MPGDALTLSLEVDSQSLTYWFDRDEDVAIFVDNGSDFDAVDRSDYLIVHDWSFMVLNFISHSLPSAATEVLSASVDTIIVPTEFKFAYLFVRLLVIILMWQQLRR